MRNGNGCTYVYTAFSLLRIWSIEIVEELATLFGVQFHVRLTSFVFRFSWDQNGTQTRRIQNTAKKIGKYSAAEIVLIIDEVDPDVAKTLNHIERNGG
jgi:hypothetical protein